MNDEEVVIFILFNFLKCDENWVYQNWKESRKKILCDGSLANVGTYSRKSIVIHLCISNMIFEKCIFLYIVINHSKGTSRD